MTESNSTDRVLSRMETLAAEDRPLLKVHVPEWGGSVMIQAASGEEAGEFRDRMYGDPDGKPFSQKLYDATLVALTARDEKGGRLYTDADIPDLARKNAAALARIAARAAEISGLSAGAVEAEVKN